MSGVVVGFEEHRVAIERESARLGTVLDAGLDLRVASCPQWVVRDLADHVVSVLGFWRTQLAAADPTSRTAVGGPAGIGEGDPAERLHEESEGLVGLLADVGPDSPCWNWAETDLRSSWVARRMALELAVHRYDGELAAGEPTPVEVALAADGLDERIKVHLALDVTDAPEATLGGSLCLDATDCDVAFVVEVGGGRLHVREGTGPASAYCSGTASDLFLFSWNRVAPDRLALTGDEAVVGAWRRLPV